MKNSIKIGAILVSGMSLLFPITSFAATTPSISLNAQEQSVFNRAFCRIAFLFEVKKETVLV